MTGVFKLYNLLREVRHLGWLFLRSHQWMQSVFVLFCFVSFFIYSRQANPVSGLLCVWSHGCFCWEWPFSSGHKYPFVEPSLVSPFPLFTDWTFIWVGLGEVLMWLSGNLCMSAQSLFRKILLKLPPERNLNEVLLNPNVGN